MTLVGDLLDFSIKKNSFSGFDNFLERFPIIKASWFSVYVEESSTILILPYLGVLHNLDSSGISILSLFDTSR